MKKLWIVASLGVAIVALIWWSRRRENLAYLDMYEFQDLYRNRMDRPEGVAYPGSTIPVWPVVNTATTSRANVLREAEAADKRAHERDLGLFRGTVDHYVQFPAGDPTGADMRCYSY